MRRLVLRRLLSFVPAMLAIVVLSFLVIRLAPGSPLLSERALSPAVRSALEVRYGLDRPLWEQLLSYLVHLSKGDLGVSTRYAGRTVREIIADGLPVTLSVAAVAMAVTLLFGIAGGVLGARAERPAWSRGAQLFTLVGISVPTFVVGPLLALIFALHLYWLPPAGFGELRHLVLPGLTLGLVHGAHAARLVRAGLLEVGGAEFVRAARAKGLLERVVWVRHLLRPGLLPLLSWLGPATAQLMVGSVVVERIFAIPGLGPYFVDAAFNRDYFLVMGLVILYSGLLLFANLVADVLLGLLDPRTREVA